MSKSFILVPEELFQKHIANRKPMPPSFVRSQSHHKTEKRKTGKKYDSLLNNRNLDLSTRNLLYNQNLVANMKHKQNLQNKPIPIRMESHPELAEDQIYIRRPDFLPSRTEELQDIPVENIESDIEIDDRHVVRGRGRDERRERDPFDRHVVFGRGRDARRGRSLSPPGFDRPEAVRHRFPLNRRKKDISKEANLLFEKMRQDKDIFRVTDDARILKLSRRGVVEKSRPGDVLKILRHILGDKLGGYIPAGYERFKRDLFESPLAAEIIAKKRELIDRYGHVGEGWVSTNSLKSNSRKIIRKGKKLVNRTKPVKKRFNKKVIVRKESSKYKSAIERVLKWPRRN